MTSNVHKNSVNQTSVEASIVDLHHQTPTASQWEAWSLINEQPGRGSPLPENFRDLDDVIPSETSQTVAEHSSTSANTSQASFPDWSQFDLVEIAQKEYRSALKIYIQLKRASLHRSAHSIKAPDASLDLAEIQVKKAAGILEKMMELRAAANAATQSGQLLEPSFH